MAFSNNKLVDVDVYEIDDNSTEICINEDDLNNQSSNHFIILSRINNSKLGLIHENCSICNNFIRHVKTLVSLTVPTSPTTTQDSSQQQSQNKHENEEVTSEQFNSQHENTNEQSDQFYSQQSQQTKVETLTGNNFPEFNFEIIEVYSQDE